MQKFFLTSIFICNIIFANFPFSGKVTGNKVRLRTSASLDSKIIKKMNKEDLLLITGEKGDFYAVKPPEDIRLYVSKPYIQENTVTAERVHIRLLPSLQSPIIGKLQKKEHVLSYPSKNNEWVEIAPSDGIYFYISKSYIQKIGDASLFTQMQKKKQEVEKLLNSAFFLAQAECKKPFDEMHPKEAIRQFETIIKGYSEFTDHVKQAKEGLALLQDTYLQKKISYLEGKANISSLEKKEVFQSVKSFDSQKKAEVISHPLKEDMKKWVPTEKEIFNSWSNYHPNQSIDHFYEEQQANGITITGVIEKYDHNIQNKPGDYLLKSETVHKAYLYSTKIDLEQFIGKKITITASPRPNNGFAYPAYFVTNAK